jgi:hypothetical protein
MLYFIPLNANIFPVSQIHRNDEVKGLPDGGVTVAVVVVIPTSSRMSMTFAAIKGLMKLHDPYSRGALR